MLASLDGVDELVNFSGLLSLASLLLDGLVLHLALLAAELVEEVGDEAKNAHVGGVHISGGLSLFWDLLDDVAGHQEEKKEPTEDEEGDENYEEPTGGVANSLSIAVEGSIIKGPSVVNTVAIDADSAESDEEGNGEGPDIPVGGVR